MLCGRSRGGGYSDTLEKGKGFDQECKEKTSDNGVPGSMNLNRPLPFDRAPRDLRMNRAVARFTNSKLTEPAGRWRYQRQRLAVWRPPLQIQRQRKNANREIGVPRKCVGVCGVPLIGGLNSVSFAGLNEGHREDWYSQSGACHDPGPRRGAEIGRRRGSVSESGATAD